MRAEEARQRLEDASYAVTAAERNVEDVRESLAVSAATPRDVASASRQLDRARERKAQAEAAVRVAEREEQAEAVRAKAESARIASALAAIYRDKREKEQARYRSWLLSLDAQAREFDASLKKLSELLHEGATGQYPSRWTSWQFLAGFLSDQLGHVTRPGSSSQPVPPIEATPTPAEGDPE